VRFLSNVEVLNTAIFRSILKGNATEAKSGSSGARRTQNFAAEAVTKLRLDDLVGAPPTA
jgi:hypothetical protein